MSDIKWEEGKTYRFKPDMIEEFKRNSGSNPKIARILGGNTFTVGIVCRLTGRVLSLLGYYSNDDINIEYWFTGSEIKYFELVEESNMNNTNNIRPIADIVVEFLDKLVYVSANDYTVTDMLYLNKDGAVLTTDFADFRGGKQIYEFVTQRYDLLQQEAKHKKNNELMERKAKLEAELAEVNKELGNA